MTSNIGSDLITRDTTLGFTAGSEDGESRVSDYERMKNNVLDEIKKFFRPEFLNRIDGTVVFHALSREHMNDIVELDLKDVASGLLEKGINFEVTDEAKEWIADKGYDPVFGARPLRRVVQDNVEDKLSDGVLEGIFNPGDTAVVELQEGEIVVRSKPPVPASSPS